MDDKKVKKIKLKMPTLSEALKDHQFGEPHFGNHMNFVKKKILIPWTTEKKRDSLRFAICSMEYAGNKIQWEHLRRLFTFISPNFVLSHIITSQLSPDFIL